MSHPDPNGPAATTPYRVGDESTIQSPASTPCSSSCRGRTRRGRARAEMTARVGTGAGRAHPPGLDGVVHGPRRRADREARRQGPEARPGPVGDRGERPLARLVECRGPGRPGPDRGHARRAVRAHARDDVRSCQPQPRRREGDAQPAPACGHGTGVLGGTVVFKSPPPAMQKAMFAMLAPLAHAMGYRGTYPQPCRARWCPRRQRTSRRCGSPGEAGRLRQPTRPVRLRTKSTSTYSPRRSGSA